jgi:branched-chain amino acid transport system substrate-binding protein
LLKSLKANGIKSDTAEIVYISEEVVSNAAGTKLYPALLDEAGITHGDPIPVQYKSFDMSAQAAQILASNPDLVAIAALPDSASKVIGELRRQGYEGRIIGSQIFSDPNVVELFGPEGIKKAGAHHSDAQAYDTFFLLKQVMETVGTTGDPDKLEEEREAIVAGMEGVTFSGILGDDICFNGHDAELPGYIIEIRDGEWTKFDSAPADKCE